MKCRHCGYDIPEGKLICPVCGEEVRIVPDYNPLDEVLTEEVKVSVSRQERNNTARRIHEEQRRRASGNTRQMGNTRSRDYGRTSSMENTRSREYGRTSSMNRQGYGSSGYGATGRQGVSQRTSSGRKREREMRREAQIRAAEEKRNRVIAISVVSVLLVAIAIGVILFFSNSYNGLINKGDKAFNNGDYVKAAQYYQKAVEKNPKKAQAYDGLASIQIEKNDLAKAELVYSGAVANQPENADLFQAFIKFYIATGQQDKIPILLNGISGNMYSKLKEYAVDVPVFSLEEGKTYEDVQQLELTADDMKIFYTTDGTKPTSQSTQYLSPITIDEGESLISAIAVNDDGIPSLPVTKIFKVEFPIDDAPAVSPSTGQYSQATKIEIKVPEGFTAYYTTDKSDPTSASTQYKGPFDMPEGETILKAILVNARGRMSQITTRNYHLEIEPETPEENADQAAQEPEG
ncbi:MAG: chitobiase/beta-hexosaminidase C-terminal domain-containing protein [Lachnospiraceae bacterium]|jgi:hypothetical protein|nr:chitobiase/beta-hexosaminidase C-terminal domain-containing protein [Lachnospiraceae bacterium]